jgi:hypothetical protein
MSAFCSIGFSWFSDTSFVLRQVILRIPDTVFDSSKFIERQLSKHGGPKTKLVSLRDAMQLVMVLPGKVAKETRAQFAGVIERYIAGDRSLHAEIEANAGSGSGLARLARESLGIQQEREDDAVSIGMKRKREELELLKMEEEIKGMPLNRILAASAELERLRDPTRSNLDERTRLMIQDSLQNSLLLSMGGSQQQQQLLIAAGPLPSAPISISSVAAKLGYKGTSVDFQRVGMDVRKRYVAKHGKPPSKHEQLCDGRVTAVNSYTEADRGLVETALRRYFRPSTSTTGGSESSGSE